MTAPPGHVGFGLLLAAPVWLVLTDEEVLTFLRYLGLAVMVPDLDLYVPSLPHHGVTHTLAFASVLAMAGGLVAVLGSRVSTRRWIEAPIPSGERTFALAGGGLFLGAASHAVLDVFSSSADGFPIALFWPIVDHPLALDLVHFTDPVVNYGLVASALAVHVVVLYHRVGRARRSPRPAR